MSDIEIRNAKITSTDLGYGDHGIMTFTLHLDYGGAGQGAGQICLGTHEKPWRGGIAMIYRILEVVGTYDWEKLPGKHIRVKSEHSKVHEIGNVLKDDWLHFSEFAKSYPSSKDIIDKLEAEKAEWEERGTTGLRYAGMLEHQRTANEATIVRLETELAELKAMTPPEDTHE